MYPLDFHAAGQPFRTSRARGDHDESEWLALKTKDVRRNRRTLLRRFVHIIGVCFR